MLTTGELALYNIDHAAFYTNYLTVENVQTITIDVEDSELSQLVSFKYIIQDMI